MNFDILALIWDPEDEKRFGLDVAAFRKLGIQDVRTDYAAVGRDPGLADKLRSMDVEAAVFTRNEDMSKRPFIGRFLASAGLGYTCISGIDRDKEDAQTRECIQAFLAGPSAPSVAPAAEAVHTEAHQDRPTVAFIFDFEQFGGAIYGIPRLLPLIESFGVRATFFVTGFMERFFPTLMERIAAGGHEIGAHGGVHEFLQGRSLADQTARLTEQKTRLGRYAPVYGANFIYRMDNQSPEAMAAAGLQYFTLFRKRVFYRTRFLPASGRIRSFRTGAGDLSMMPVGVETYGLPWAEIQGSLDAFLKQARHGGSNHVSILMHPFKDGAEANLPITERLLRYTLHTMGLASIPLSDVAKAPHPTEDAVQLRYLWEGHKTSQHNMRSSSYADWWWRPVVYHALRVEKLADALGQLGRETVLTTGAPDEKASSIYPDGGNEAFTPIDPLIQPKAAAMAVERQAQPVNFTPASRSRDLLNALVFHAPRTWWDIRVFVSRTARKILG